MANSKRFVVKNGLETQNIQFVTADGTEKIIATVLEDGTLSFSGTSGQLFSIVDSLTGSIFSVNDISGIPSIEVFDDGKVILAESTGNVGIGTLTPTQKLTVNGNVSATRLISTQATGTAPFTVTSTTKVDNLNADLLDGLDSTAFYLATNPSGYTTNTGTVTAVTGTSPVASSGGTAPAISLASGYGDTQNPYGTKNVNTVLAGPGSGTTAAVPTFRALVAADIPTLNQNTTGTSAGVVRTVAGTTSAELVRGNMADNDQARILVGGTATNAGFLEIATADDGTEPIHVRQYTGAFATLTRTATLLDGSGNTSFPGTITGTRLISSIADGTAPLAVTSTTAVANLNADLLDGNHASAFALSSHTHAISDVTGLQTALDGKVDESREGQAEGIATLDSGGTLTASQVPYWVGSGMRNLGAVNVTDSSTNTLSKIIAYFGSYFSYSLEDRQMTGSYFVVTTGGALTQGAAVSGASVWSGVWGSASYDDGQSPTGTGDAKSLTVETGDFLIVTGVLKTSPSSVQITFDVINNTYGTATTTTNGVVTLSSQDTYANLSGNNVVTDGVLKTVIDNAGFAVASNYLPLTGGNITGNLNASGNVGIGTITPAVKLDVVGQVAISTETYPSLSVETTSTQTNLQASSGVFSTSTSGNMADGFGSGIQFAIEDDANVRNSIGFIGAVRSGADNSGRLNFFTNNAGTSTEKMTILPSGNVGIGTTSPGEILHVRKPNLLGSTANNYVNLTRLSGLAVNEFMVNDFFVRESNGGDWETAAYVRGISVDVSFLVPNTSLRSWIKQNPSANSVQFGSASSTYLTVNPTGVGIGTTTPSQKLDVLGNARIQGNILLDGTATTTNQDRTISFTGFDKELTTDFSDAAFIRHTINTGGHSGSVLELSSQNDSTDGIALTTNASSQIRHNGHIMWDANNDGAASGLDADLLDGQHGSYFLDTSGSSQTKSGNLTVTGNISSGRYYQSANGIPTGNLGNPTVTEMALFDEQFYNQTAFYDISRLKFYSSTDGTTFTEITTITDGQKRTLVGGDNGGGVTIPNLTPYYRIEITNNGNYVFLNALYLYMTTSSHATSVKIRARRRSDLTFVNFATSNNTVNLWPGHVYLPFSTIPFLTGGSSSGHYDIVHIDFQPTWSGDPTYGTQPIFIQKLQIWGGYPAGKRNVFSTDENANVAFPAALTGSRLISNIATGTSPLVVTSTTAVTNLNADLLDGRQGLAYAQTGSDFNSNGSDINNIKTSGMWRLAENTNLPSNYYYGQVFVSRGGDTTAQILVDYNSASMAFRGASDGGGWQPWATVWNDLNDGTGSGLDADLLDGQHGNAYLRQIDEVIVNIASPDSTSGTWTATDTDDWGTPRIGSIAARYNDAPGFLQFNIPAGMDTAYISQLTWSSGGYVDVYGVQADAGLVFLRRINTRQAVENTNEGAGGGNPNQHDGSAVTLAATGLSTFTAIRLQNKLGRLHLTGMSFSSNRLQGAEGTGMVHPGQLSFTGTGSGLDADLLDGNHASAFVSARTRTDWNNATSVISNVIGELAWKNFGNGHTIFDASNSTAPGGTAKNNTNPDIFWSATYPTLMGWNGTNTFGVRVDSARAADSADNIDGIGFSNRDSTNGVTPNNSTINGLGYTSGISPTLLGQTDGGLYTSTYSANWIHQIYGDFRTGQIAVRGKNNGTWQDWRTVWDSANDGAGSTLDADLLDGNHASAFYLVSNPSGYISSESDTLQTVTGRGQSSDQALTLSNAIPLTFSNANPEIKFGSTAGRSVSLFNDSNVSGSFKVVEIAGGGDSGSNTILNLGLSGGNKTVTIANAYEETTISIGDLVGQGVIVGAPVNPTSTISIGTLFGGTSASQSFVTIGSSTSGSTTTIKSSALFEKDVTFAGAFTLQGKQLALSNLPQVFRTFTLTNANATIAGGDTSGLVPGQLITGTGIQSNTVINSITNSTTLVMSKTATTSGSQSLQFGPSDSYAVSSGIIVKGTTDKSIVWEGANGWTVYGDNTGGVYQTLSVVDSAGLFGATIAARISSTQGTSSNTALQLDSSTGTSGATNYGAKVSMNSNVSSTNYGIYADMTSGSSVNYFLNGEMSGTSSSNILLRGSLSGMYTTGLDIILNGTTGRVGFLIQNDLLNILSGKVRFGNPAIAGDFYNIRNRLDLVVSGAESDEGIMIVRDDTTTTTNEILGGIGFDSTDGNPGSSILKASTYIASYAAENHSATEKGGYLTFGTSPLGKDANVTATERMRIEAGGNVGIGTATPSAKLDVAGDIEHTGLTMTSGTNVDQTKETTFTSALTTAWTDVTGVSGTYLATGSHIVQIISNGEYYTGTLSWFSGTTTSTVVDEIVLHRAGPAASAGRIYARVIRTSSAPSTLKLQVSGSASISSHTMTFKFRRTI